MDALFFLFLAIFFLSFFAQAVVGFGGNILALTLGALFFPVDLLLSWLIPQVILLSAWLSLKHRQHIDWALLLKVILPFMGAGMLVGMSLFNLWSVDVLKKILGVVVIALALKELLQTSAGGSRRSWPWMLSAGVVHGMFAAGGPLLVYGIAGRVQDKAVFRATLAVVWLILGLVLLLNYWLAGNYAASSISNIAIMAAVLPLAIILGEWVHHKVPESAFRRMIYILLIVAGLALLLR